MAPSDRRSYVAYFEDADEETGNPIEGTTIYARYKNPAKERPNMSRPRSSRQDKSDRDQEHEPLRKEGKPRTQEHPSKQPKESSKPKKIRPIVQQGTASQLVDDWSDESEHHTNQQPTALPTRRRATSRPISYFPPRSGSYLPLHQGFTPPTSMAWQQADIPPRPSNPRPSGARLSYPFAMSPPPLPHGYPHTYFPAPLHSGYNDHRSQIAAAQPPSTMGVPGGPPPTPRRAYSPEMYESETYVTRRPPRSSTSEEDRRRMPPPSSIPQRPMSAISQRPPAAPVRHYQPRPSSDSYPVTFAYEHGDWERGLSPEPIRRRSSEYEDAGLESRPGSLRPLSAENSDRQARYIGATQSRRGSRIYGGVEIIPAGEYGRRASTYISGGTSRRSTRDGFESKIADAQSYQDALSETNIPLTAELLRRAARGNAGSRSTRSSSSRDESDYHRSSTTRTTITASSVIEEYLGFSDTEDNLRRDSTIKIHALERDDESDINPMTDPHNRHALGLPSTMQVIGDRIRKKLGIRSRLNDEEVLKLSQVVRMTISVGWNPIMSLREAGFVPPYEDSLGRIVCLSGSWSEAQATTVEEYMEQTWPGRGHFLIALLQTLVSIPEGEECSFEVDDPEMSQHDMSDGAAQPLKTPHLRASIQSSYICRISAIGDAHFVAEIVEQLAWLGSALQYSWGSQTPVACNPCLRDLEVSTQASGYDSSVKDASCNLGFILSSGEKTETISGLCWRQLLCSPVLARGFPILPRTRPDTGLELSLASMAALVGSYQAIQWGGRIMIKSYHMLAVTALMTVDAIVWHLFVSKQPGERISYVDPQLCNITDDSMAGLSLRSLEEQRHIIGWCSSISDLCGDPAASLDIGGAGLPEPPASTFIDKLYIKAGSNFIAGGFEMRFNQKEKPFWLVRDQDYPSLIKWISIQPIVFYDVGDDRAWLTDGASALLHLLRASLHLNEQDPDAVYDWVFDSTKFQDKWPGLTARQAALKTLANWENLNLNVYVTSKQPDGAGGVITKYSTVKQRVENLLHSLEILIDKQAEHNSQSGIRIPQRRDARGALLGFDIRDIIESHGIARTRIHPNASWAHGWMDLIRAMGTISIFGQGFGDLLCPKVPDSLCRGWRSVPVGKGYMAASVSTLQLLYERRLLRIQPDLGPGKLTSKIIWATPRHPFQPCACLTGTTSSTASSSNSCCHDDSVQFLLAEASWRLLHDAQTWTPVEVMKLEKEGAVIFGKLPPSGRRKKESSSMAAELRHNDQDAASSPGQSSHETMSVSFTSRSTSRSTSSGPASISSVPSSSGSTDTANEERTAKKATKGTGKKPAFFAKIKKFAS